MLNRDFPDDPITKILTLNVRGLGLTSDQRTRSQVLQLRVQMLQLRPNTTK